MKQLLLVRHGEAKAQTSGLKDIDRVLTRQGHQDAPDMANRFVEKGVIPDRLISSNANRALLTARHFAKVWNKSPEQLTTDAAIYEADLPTLLKVITSIDNRYNKAALFGHNPGFTDLANYLSDAYIYAIPPSGLVWIEFAVDDWTMISKATGTLLLFDYPRDSNDR